jgi:hypothetical protein
MPTLTKTSIPAAVSNIELALKARRPASDIVTARLISEPAANTIPWVPVDAGGKTRAQGGAAACRRRVPTRQRPRFAQARRGHVLAGLFEHWGGEAPVGKGNFKPNFKLGDCSKEAILLGDLIPAPSRFRRFYSRWKTQ